MSSWYPIKVLGPSPLWKLKSGTPVEPWLQVVPSFRKVNLFHFITAFGFKYSDNWNILSTLFWRMKQVLWGWEKRIHSLLLCLWVCGGQAVYCCQADTVTLWLQFSHTQPYQHTLNTNCRLSLNKQHSFSIKIHSY